MRAGFGMTGAWGVKARFLVYSVWGCVVLWLPMMGKRDTNGRAFDEFLSREMKIELDCTKPFSAVEFNFHLTA
jgi:hypothetical protein